MRILFILIIIAVIFSIYMFTKAYKDEELKNLRNLLQIETEEDVDKWIKKQEIAIDNIMSDITMNSEKWNTAIATAQDRLAKLKELKLKLNKLNSKND